MRTQRMKQGVVFVAVALTGLGLMPDAARSASEANSEFHSTPEEPDERAGAAFELEIDASTFAPGAVREPPASSSIHLNLLACMPQKSIGPVVDAVITLRGSFGGQTQIFRQLQITHDCRSAGAVELEIADALNIDARQRVYPTQIDIDVTAQSNGRDLTRQPVGTLFLVFDREAGWHLLRAETFAERYPHFVTDETVLRELARFPYPRLQGVRVTYGPGVYMYRPFGAQSADIDD